MKCGTLILALALGGLCAATVAFGSAAADTPDPPALSPDSNLPPNPAVFISTQKGFRVKPCPEPSCKDKARLIPARQGACDLDGLQKELVILKKRYRDTTPLTLMPAGDLPWHVVVRTLDRIQRAPDGKPLFEVVFLGLGGR